MARTIVVEIDSAGNVHALGGERLPKGRARLTLMSPEEWENWDWMKLSEVSLAKDWLRPEEDEAWAYLQQKTLGDSL